MENKKEHTDDCPYCKDINEEDSCPYCDEQDSVESTDDCPYCKDVESDDEHSCPYCDEIDSRSNGDDHDVEQTNGPTVTEPTAESGEDYAGVDLAPPELDKPKESERVKIGLASTSIEGMDDQHNTPSNEALTVKDGVPVEEEVEEEIVEEPADEYNETPEDILQQLDDDGSDSTSDDRSVNNADNAGMTTGDNAEGNVSRPDDFWTDIPGDMGLSEEEDAGPDLSGVLQEDLDGQAEGIQREKVVQMVSEALEGFKGCKDVLERAKAQAPNLYQSSIAMLRAMIEMADMLGLGQSDETAEEVVGQESPQGNMPEGKDGQPSQDAGPESGDDAHDWQDPFPKHPDHGGQPKDDDKNQIGQPLGKLPTKNTTAHVTRTPMPEGGVNAKGQKKVIDPVTGKTRWINMKEGKVQSPTGVPVKPPKDKKENA